MRFAGHWWRAKEKQVIWTSNNGVRWMVTQQPFTVNSYVMTQNAPLMILRPWCKIMMVEMIDWIKNITRNTNNTDSSTLHLPRFNFASLIKPKNYCCHIWAWAAFSTLTEFKSVWTALWMISTIQHLAQEWNDARFLLLRRYFYWKLSE